MEKKKSKTEQLNRLFVEWSVLHTKESDEEYRQYHSRQKGSVGYVPKNNFICDGIFSADGYENAETNVLFIAKECNLNSDNAYINEEVKTDPNDFWAKKTVAAWRNGEKTRNVFLSGLAMLCNATKANDYSVPDKSADALAGAALINLNKRGGYDYCVWDTLEAYVGKYAEMIKREINAIDPDQIICCGESVFYLIKKYHLADGREVRTAYHPSYFGVSDKEKLHFLLTGKKSEKAGNGTYVEREQRGYILDTNNLNGIACEQEMMKDHRAYAYGDARQYLGWFRENDYVLFYSRDMRGIIAVGKAVMPGNDDRTDTSWWEVEPIVPEDFRRVNGKRRALSMDAVNAIVYGNLTGKICMRGTVKRKIIELDKVEQIIGEMKKLWGET